MSESDRDQLLLDTLNLLARVGDRNGFQLLTEKAGKPDVGPVKTARLFELAPVINISDLRKAKGVGPTKIRYMQEGLVKYLKNARVSTRKPLTVERLQAAITKLAGTRPAIEATSSAFYPLALSTMPMIQFGPGLAPASILGPKTLDEWFRLMKEVKDRGEAHLGTETHRSWSNNAKFKRYTIRSTDPCAGEAGTRPTIIPSSTRQSSASTDCPSPRSKTIRDPPFSAGRPTVTSPVARSKYRPSPSLKSAAVPRISKRGARSNSQWGKATIRVFPLPTSMPGSSSR